MFKHVQWGDAGLHILLAWAKWFFWSALTLLILWVSIPWQWAWLAFLATQVIHAARSVYEIYEREVGQVQAAFFDFDFRKGWDLRPPIYKHPEYDDLSISLANKDYWRRKEQFRRHMEWIPSLIILVVAVVVWIL